MTQENKKELVAATSPLATSIIHGINPEMTDLSVPKTIRPLFGEPFLKEDINGFTYKIQPASFFQTNSEMAARLQDTVVEFAALNEKETCLDLYCGCGFLSLPLARHAKELVGVELDEPAVTAARENAALNSVKNAIFSSGASEALLPITLSRDKPDVIVVDPPRPGLHPEALAELMRYGAKRLVYVSCNPASLARDLKTLLNIYQIKKSRCLDLFPHTPHIETVVSLINRK
jgi:23S rRNA (uracil1939-C5)-methyltransferase